MLAERLTACVRFIMCQEDNKQAAMIISEFTGCSRSLSGAFRVNPWASEEVLLYFYCVRHHLPFPGARALVHVTSYDGIHSLTGMHARLSCCG